MIIKKAYGCYIEDDQGKVYIDTTMGSGAQILGHGNKLIKKITAQVVDGTIYTVPNFHTQEVCKLLKKINPEYSEKYIFCNSGTEANMRAIRLARAFTGKKIIGRFQKNIKNSKTNLIENFWMKSRLHTKTLNFTIKSIKML